MKQLTVWILAGRLSSSFCRDRSDTESPHWICSSCRLGLSAGIGSKDSVFNVGNPSGASDSNKILSVGTYKKLATNGLVLVNKVSHKLFQIWSCWIWHTNRFEHFLGLCWFHWHKVPRKGKVSTKFSKSRNHFNRSQIRMQNQTSWERSNLSGKKKIKVVSVVGTKSFKT